MASRPRRSRWLLGVRARCGVESVAVRLVAGVRYGVEFVAVPLVAGVRVRRGIESVAVRLAAGVRVWCDIESSAAPLVAGCGSRAASTPRRFHRPSSGESRRHAGKRLRPGPDEPGPYRY
ncbi:hypothetical protein AB0E59_14840 [Lentzea sp. NPDC034063]|uniref:hypothetical protein n=1 Tax=unclassified Lentzea TaxID=2643253 RepID=UPI0034019B2D